MNDDVNKFIKFCAKHKTAFTIDGSIAFTFPKTVVFVPYELITIDSIMGNMFSDITKLPIKDVIYTELVDNHEFAAQIRFESKPYFGFSYFPIKDRFPYRGNDRARIVIFDHIEGSIWEPVMYDIRDLTLAIVEWHRYVVGNNGNV